jgi:hypothetical protein
MSSRQRLRPIRRKPGTYLGELVSAFQTGRLSLAPGTLSVAEIRHDGWGPKLRGGACRCKADIEIKPLDEVTR